MNRKTENGDYPIAVSEVQLCVFGLSHEVVLVVWMVVVTGADRSSAILATGLYCCCPSFGGCDCAESTVVYSIAQLEVKYYTQVRLSLKAQLFLFENLLPSCLT
jgi:hypothetical protein